MAGIMMLLTVASPLLAQQPADSTQFRQLSLERFGLDVWQKVSHETPKGNLLFSPASLTMALSLTYAGATGGTAEAFAKTLGIPENRHEGYDSAASAWLAHLKTQKAVELSMANSLWASQSFPLLSDYRARMSTLYQGEVERVDLTSARSVELINAWVSRETRDRIPRLFDKPPLELDTGMVLLNALYFKGKWTSPFDSTGTRARPFHPPGGRTVWRPSMEQTGNFGYLRGDRFQALRLPYSDGGFAMYVLLPDSGESVAKIAALTDSSAWVNSLAGYRATEVRVVLPKFSVRTGLDLNSPLKAAGLEVAFGPSRAEFYHMVSNKGGIRAWITQVLQKSMMEVAEQGTVAAATTSVTMTATQSVPPPPIDFKVDRPFVVVLRDEGSGMLLFIGRIVDPRIKD
jgi:serpin B